MKSAERELEHYFKRFDALWKSVIGYIFVSRQNFPTVSKFFVYGAANKLLFDFSKITPGETNIRQLCCLQFKKVPLGHYNSEFVFLVSRTKHIDYVAEKLTLQYQISSI